MVWGKDEGNVSDGVVNGTDESVWSVEKNGVIYLPPRRSGGGAGKSGVIYPHPRRNGGDVGKNDVVCPPRQIGVWKNGWVGPHRIESGADDVSFHCLSASRPPPHPPYASSGDSYLSRGPSPGPNHEKTRPAIASPSPP